MGLLTRWHPIRLAEGPYDGGCTATHALRIPFRLLPTIGLVRLSFSFVLRLMSRTLFRRFIFLLLPRLGIDAVDEACYSAASGPASVVKGFCPVASSRAPGLT